MKIDNYDQHRFLIRFLEISGVKKEGIDVSTSYLLQASPGVKIKRNDMLTHTFFLLLRIERNQYVTLLRKQNF